MIKQTFLPKIGTSYSLVEQSTFPFQLFTINIQSRLYSKHKREGKLGIGQNWLLVNDSITLPAGTEIRLCYAKYHNVNHFTSRINIINVSEEASWILLRQDGKQGKGAFWLPSVDLFNSLILEEITDETK